MSGPRGRRPTPAEALAMGRALADRLISDRLLAEALGDDDGQGDQPPPP